jgi:hypothetical protein
MFERCGLFRITEILVVSADDNGVPYILFKLSTLQPIVFHFRVQM